MRRLAMMRLSTWPMSWTPSSCSSGFIASHANGCSLSRPSSPLGDREDDPVARADAEDLVVAELLVEGGEDGEQELVAELVALQPLGQDPARLQVALGLAVELDGEQARDAADPWVGRLRDDDVELPRGPGEVGLGVVEPEVIARVSNT